MGLSVFTQPLTGAVAQAVSQDETNCREGIERLEAALAEGVGDADDRREAEGELDEAFEAVEGSDWENCLDALEEAFEALDLD